MENAIDKASERDVPDILCSALTDDCIGRGKTIKEGGAVYDFISGLQVGIANMADSLAAVKKLVYDEKKISRDELWNAILDDFQSPENQKIQEMLINDAPKYGNDNDDVDLLVVRAYDTYIDEIKKYPSTRYHRGPIAVSATREPPPSALMWGRVWEPWPLRTDATPLSRWRRLQPGP